MEQGRKDDSGKPRWTLVPLDAMHEIIKVLEYGAKKYEAENWKKVPGPRLRYINAIFRHLVSYTMGEKTDPESGFSHLAHIGASILFLLWFDLHPGSEK